MTELEMASAHRVDAPRGCPAPQSARGAGFTRCDRPAQLHATAPTIHRSTGGLPAAVACLPVSPIAPVASPVVTRRAVPRRAASVIILALLATATAVAFVRWPRGIDSITADIRQLNGSWVVPAIALAGLSMLAAALQQRRVLRAAGLSLPLRSMMAITLAGNAVSVTLPLAGSTAGTAFTYMQLRKRGADVPTATWALAMCGIISTTVLAVVLGVGAGVTGDGATSVVGAVAVLLGIVPIGVLLISLRSPMVRAHAERVAERVLARLQRSKHGTNPSVVVARAFERMAGFRVGWRAGAAASAYSAMNWVTDATCLAMCVSALGVPVPWTHLVIIYGATLGAASLSFTPAGIGIVESAIALALVQSGVPASAAVVAALLYRAVSCWLA
ncbi:MAG: lysylphosphatidylglycerol synthase transmembrane domain-containing protein, partial [Ilumatobacteraceae bacterium]